MLAGFGVSGGGHRAATQVPSTSFISPHGPKNTATERFPRLTGILGSLSPCLETHRPANSGNRVHDDALGFHHCIWPKH